MKPRPTILVALCFSLLATACAEKEGAPLADAGQDRQAPSLDRPQAASEALLPRPPDQSGGGCATTPLPLTRFPMSLRTTASGRTFAGWGGAAAPGTAKRPPVILIHGNGGTADEWTSWRSHFCKAGYSDLELWAITFQDSTCSGMCTKGSNTEHATELETMVALVRAQTNAKRVSLVAVSMGVPAARYYIKYLWGVANKEVALAYLVSGPNHGLQACDLPGAAMINVACAELDAAAVASGWLHKLNHPDETPSGQGDGLPDGQHILYRTVNCLDDEFFPGSYAKSPVLEGADNLDLPNAKHATIDVSDLLAYLKKAL